MTIYYSRKLSLLQFPFIFWWSIVSLRILNQCKKKVNSYAKLHECNLAFSTAEAKRAKSIENGYFSLNAAMVLVEFFFIGSFVAFTLLDGYLARRFCRTKCFQLPKTKAMDLLEKRQATFLLNDCCKVLSQLDCK